MATLNGFDKISVVYDSLARIIYGKSIQQSQVYFLDRIPPHASVLILGGGTGWILEKINEVQPSVKIDYIEASSKMLRLARDKNQHHNNIQYIHGTEQDVTALPLYDVIITNFFLDLFPDKKLSSVVRLILSKLKHDGCWIVTDFVNERKWWQRVLLSVMYVFFKITTGIEASTLPDWNQVLTSSALEPTEVKTFYHGFIKTGFFVRRNV
jgi:tRNA (cmo5U34)-methyltransferase